MSRLDAAFAQARQEGRAAFIPYLTAGFPNKRDFITHAKTLLKHADILEIGLPYSDPLGDGPTIQRSSEKALEQGIGTKETFALIKQLRAVTDKPLVLMTYYNPIYCYQGGQSFAHDLKDAGADGIILPDLPPDEGEDFIAEARAAQLDTIFLVAPTSTKARLKFVTRACRGFVYAVSVTGVTGARHELPSDVSALVKSIKAVSDLPIAVGFGVSSGDTARAVAAVADGVVVGSALIAAIDQARDLDSLASNIAKACQREG